MKKINNFFENKKILILGYGREGKSTHKYIIDNNINCDLYISDQRDITNEIIDEKVTIVSCESFLKDLENYDIIMQSPGVTLKDINIINIKDKIYSQTELFFEVYKNQIIGITGTKGKSTTTSLITELFKNKGYKTLILGNIGIPFFTNIEDIDDETIIVAELSCHQLEFVKVSPHIGIIINIYPEHLNHYKSFEEYKQTKINIVRFQEKDDYAIINIDNEYIKEFAENNELIQNVYNLSSEKENLFHVKQNKIYYNNEVIFDENDKRELLGTHNLYNIMTLFVVAKIYNIPFDDVKNTVANFKGLEHRMELVTEINGVKYYNDSISTIPETCIAALETLQETDTIIIGGMDRGISYDKLINKINSLPNLKVICMNEVGKKIYDQINNEKYLIDDMKEVVNKAKEITNKICIMSPAAPSYGYYKNFEDRGTQFKNAVLNK